MNSHVADENEKEKPKLPSVYSRKEIERHKKRIKILKALEENNDSEDSSDHDENVSDSDHDLDINLRIFEESAKVNNVIGEIQCNIFDEVSEEGVRESSKNASNIFKLSVNTNFANSDENNGDKIEERSESCVAESTSDLSELSDYDFIDNYDSDLEILMSKSIIKKKANPPVRREKTSENKQKITMYDLIYDNPTLKNADNESDKTTEKKEFKSKKNSQKKNETDKDTTKKVKFKNIESNEKDIREESKSSNSQLPVPKLRVGADGDIIVDMDSLIIDQTGISEAREALANSDVVNETALNYKSYTKKNGNRKQWTPHETLKFYQVLSAVGTDFTLMATLFPGRTRNCLKRKFKREEKMNKELVLKALYCKQNFDIGLLKKELDKKDQAVKILTVSKQQEIEKNKAASKRKTVEIKKEPTKRSRKIITKKEKTKQKITFKKKPKKEKKEIKKQRKKFRKSLIMDAVDTRLLMR